MRRAALLLCLLLPLAACGDEAESVGAPAAASPSSYVEVTSCRLEPGDRTEAPDFADICKRRNDENNRQAALDFYCPNGDFFGGDPQPDLVRPSDADCDSVTPSPTPYTPPQSPPEPTDTLESASALLGSSGGEVTMVKGLSPSQVLAVLVPGKTAKPMSEVCDEYGVVSAPERPGQVVNCLTARSVGEWTVVYGANDLTVGLGRADVLDRLSADGREVVFVADHFEADAPFVVSRDGKEVRRFDFCSEGSADEGRPLAEEKGLVLDSCEFERFELVQRLTGLTVSEDVLTSGDRLAVVTRY